MSAAVRLVHVHSPLATYVIGIISRSTNTDAGEMSRRKETPVAHGLGLTSLIRDRWNTVQYLPCKLTEQLICNYFGLGILLHLSDTNTYIWRFGTLRRPTAATSGRPSGRLYSVVAMNLNSSRNVWFDFRIRFMILRPFLNCHELKPSLECFDFD